MSQPRIAIVPDDQAYAVRAVTDGGGVVVGAAEHPDALVLAKPGREDLRSALQAAPDVPWVQLPFAGIEDVVELLDTDRTWTCAKGVYAEPVAEHALAMALGGLRRLPERALATGWGEQGGESLYDADVTVLGAGGITAALLDLLAPFRVRTTVVRRDASTPFPGAHRTVGLDALDEVLPGALVVVLALALTPETESVIGARQLECMDSGAVLVNVARGRHVDTDALVAALTDQRIGGAGLDVTEPEPLPDGHPLWTLPNALVTPHTANSWATAQPLLARRITENVRRFARGEDLLGLVDVAAGY